jgi:hypothetical protein
MVHAATFPSEPTPSPAERAERVLEVSASAWQLAPRSRQALARRAPHGYVPRRARLRAAAQAAAQAALLPCGPVLLGYAW